jgi:hypothetical protein
MGRKMYFELRKLAKLIVRNQTGVLRAEAHFAPSIDVGAEAPTP